VAGPTIVALGLAGFALPGIRGPYWATFLAPMLLTGFGMALTVAPLTTSVLASVEPAAAGIASGVNNTAARAGTVLAVAIVGVLVAALYGRALDRRLVAGGVPADVARVLVSERQNLTNVTIPEAVPPANRASLTGIVHGAFLESFRGAVLFCAALTLLGAGLAAYTITASDATTTEPAAAIPTCDHVDAIVDPRPRSAGCAECLRTGDSWVHLRLCLSCGYVGCCDSSKNQHATKHFWSSRHPIVRSLAPGEDWRWCYVDEIAV
jgi:hypothetical protein